MSREPKLLLFCGGVASGKSTFAEAIAAEQGAVVMHEDDWLAALFSDQMRSMSDYVRCSERLRGVIGPHVVALLNAGVSVALDFPANTPELRAWMRGLIEASGAAHEMHVLDVPDEIRWQRLVDRNATNGNPFKLSREQFEQVARHFSNPDESEGFHLIKHGL